ncbi:hypothetical protein [Fibrisoma limi]|nr:hypothetical protein [Fibrisoma limi]
MTHIITIETRNETDFALFKGLADRLGLSTQEAHVDTELTEAEALTLLNRLAGSWAGDETGDELNATLQNARHFGTRDMEL